MLPVPCREAGVAWGTHRESGKRPIMYPLRALPYRAHPRVFTSTHITWGGPYSTFYCPQAGGHDTPRLRGETESGLQASALPSPQSTEQLQCSGVLGGLSQLVPG